MKYGDASWHFGGHFPSDSPTEYGGTHIALLLKWCVPKGWAGQLHKEEGATESGKLMRGEISATDFCLSSAMANSPMKISTGHCGTGGWGCGGEVGLRRVATDKIAWHGSLQGCFVPIASGSRVAVFGTNGFAARTIHHEAAAHRRAGFVDSADHLRVVQGDTPTVISPSHHPQAFWRTRGEVSGNMILWLKHHREAAANGLA